MDPVHLCISLCPVAVYLVTLASINLSGRPFIVTGVRDTLALGLAISGLVISGPIELFMPRQPQAIFGAYVWLPMLALYVLAVALISLLRKPRLILYNMQLDRLRELLTQTSLGFDTNSSWAGDSLAIPGLGVHLHIEDYPAMSIVELSSVGMKQDLGGWKRLERELRRAIRPMKSTPSVSGWIQVGFSAFILAVIVYSLLSGRQEVAQAIEQMLRL